MSPQATPSAQNVLNEPGGLFCRDLRGADYGYKAAVDYWFAWGQPDNMDADLNGVPCETVYSGAEMDVPFAQVLAGLPDNLTCEDFSTTGGSFSTAYTYWRSRGGPRLMDPDLDGLPCEDHYAMSEVLEYTQKWKGPYAPTGFVARIGGAGGSGFTVRCQDGTISHSGGRQGACSYHGGIGP